MRYEILKDAYKRDDEFIKFVTKNFDKAKAKHNEEDIEFWNKVIEIEQNIMREESGDDKWIEYKGSIRVHYPSRVSSFLNPGSDGYEIMTKAERLFREEKDKYKFVTHYKDWFIARG
jgi:hypothetical protein